MWFKAAEIISLDISINISINWAERYTRKFISPHQIHQMDLIRDNALQKGSITNFRIQMRSIELSLRLFITVSFSYCHIRSMHPVLSRFIQIHYGLLGKKSFNAFLFVNKLQSQFAFMSHCSECHVLIYSCTFALLD